MTSLHIVEDHCDILYYILRGIGSKQIPFDKNLFIHFDSHPDLLIDTELKAEEVYDKNILLEKVSIETWLLPLAQAGHISDIVWIKPEWSNQIDEGHYAFYIGQNGDHKIKVSSPLLYFISALNFAPEEELVNPKLINLFVLNFDATSECVQKCSGKLLNLIKEHNCKYLLDIDLDFFITLNPFLNLYPKAQTYEVLRTLYEFTENDISTAPSPKVAQMKRIKQIETYANIFQKLDSINANSEGSPKSNLLDFVNEQLSIDKFDNPATYEMLRNLIRTLIAEYDDKEKKIDWLTVHDAGTTVDDPKRPLPHHRNLTQALNIMKNFAQLIELLPPPKFISIARSSFDEYCPAEHVDMLQEAVCDILIQAYAPAIKYHYLDNETTNVEDKGSVDPCGTDAANASSL